MTQFMEEEAEGVWMRLAGKRFENLSHKNPTKVRMELKGKQFMPAVFYRSGYGSRAQCLRSFRAAD